MISHTVAERFLRYVQIDTESDPASPSIPSTEKQKDLARILVQELLEMGIDDAHMDEYGYVYATIPANTDKDVPVICFCSHMDTSPDCSGKDVKPIVHANYDGSDIVLPQDNKQVLRPAEHPDLKNKIGHDIITADGTTLLGADNKSGVAAIMDAANHFMSHPEIKRGKVRILFTPDEEIGRGADKVDIEKLAAAFGYTVDGEALGHMEDETFSADGVRIIIDGVSSHPGFAKGNMENAVKIAADILAGLPKDSMSPETTEGKEGFVHPVSMSGTAEMAQIDFIIRDFDDSKLIVLENQLEAICKEVLKNYPRSSYRFEVSEQYRNMKNILDKHPEIVANAMEAMKRAGLDAVKGSIRGGTDGSRLSYMGLPCPNIFAGEHAFHSKVEWVSVQDMEKATETIVNTCCIWEERA